ncbi:MAG: hypothetical protein HPY89_00620 [Pelotomaculum sp.]|nr:hypothetical protein [Pelotomaculum sp.]
MKKLAISLIVALLAVVVPLAAFADTPEPEFQSTVFYKDGILYAFDYWCSDHITLHIPPGVKVYGQMVKSDWRTAIFTPVVDPGAYSLKSGGGDYSFGLMVAALSGTGDVVADIGGRKEVIHVTNAVSAEKPVIKHLAGGIAAGIYRNGHGAGTEVPKPV